MLVTCWHPKSMKGLSSRWSRDSNFFIGPKAIPSWYHSLHFQQMLHDDHHSLFVGPCQPEWTCQPKGRHQLRPARVTLEQHLVSVKLVLDPCPIWANCWNPALCWNPEGLIERQSFVDQGLIVVKQQPRQHLDRIASSKPTVARLYTPESRFIDRPRHLKPHLPQDHQSRVT